MRFIMSTTVARLEAPFLLLAMPQVQDPFFHRSVVLLVQHDEQGSVGFIINRRTGSLVAELLQGMEIQWGGEKDLAVYFGGPVHPHLGTVLYDGTGMEGEPSGEEGVEIKGLSGVRFTRNMDDLKKLAERPPASFRLFLGYAGWGPGQLLQEILRNDWLTASSRPGPRLLGGPRRHLGRRGPVGRRRPGCPPFVGARERRGARGLNRAAARRFRTAAGVDFAVPLLHNSAHAERG